MDNVLLLLLLLRLLSTEAHPALLVLLLFLCRLTRELEKYGASTSAFAGREHLGFSIRATKMQAAEVTEILLDSVLNMR